MRIEVVYAEAERCIERGFTLAPGACVGDALALAAADAVFAGIDLEAAAVGVFGRVVTRETALADGDRVEIYRPLAEDPKLARRRRARGR
jgi:hypothetical protein